VRIGDVADGTGNTVLVGESYTAPELLHEDERMDYGYIGSPQIDPYDPSKVPAGDRNEFSEFVGSTAAPMNLVRVLKAILAKAGDPNGDAAVDADHAESSFGSYHAGGAAFCMADGSVRFLAETIGRIVSTGLGSRAGGKTAGEF
jgi:prepilin-type processing-associated H-X9-DG protein